MQSPSPFSQFPVLRSTHGMATHDLPSGDMAHLSVGHVVDVPTAAEVRWMPPDVLVEPPRVPLVGLTWLRGADVAALRTVNVLQSASTAVA